MRIIIVSNRLPFTITKNGEEFHFKESYGGLATGLRSYLHATNHKRNKINYLWFGWSGVETDNLEEQKILKSKALQEFASIPVFLKKEAIDKYYNGFSNQTLWPLFHSFPQFTKIHYDYWLWYQRVNEQFAEELLKVVEDDDLIWVHDYHLMLLPKLLKKRNPKLTVGFFLHIRFPNFKEFSLLPSNWQRSILEGIAESNVIGLHTNEYKNNFLDCIQSKPQVKVKKPNRKILVTHPMGIDFKGIRSEAVKVMQEEKYHNYKELFKDKKLIISVDRLDYIKGITQKLQSFEDFLSTNPKWHKKVQFLLIAAPSREDVKENMIEKQNIEELVGKINGQFGTLDWTPILYQHKPYPFKELIPLFAISDVAMVTSLKDGMNLVAKEYLACRADNKGMLILSKYAGAADELNKALIVDPYNIKQVSNSILEALEIPDQVKIARNQEMVKTISHQDVTKWAEDFLQLLVIAHNVDNTTIAVSQDNEQNVITSVFEE